MCEQLFPIVFFLCTLCIVGVILASFLVRIPTKDMDMLACAMITQASLLVFLVEFLVFYDEVIDVSMEMWTLLCQRRFISPVLFFEMFGSVFGALVPVTANILTVAVLAGGYLIILKRKHVA